MEPPDAGRGLAGQEEPSCPGDRREPASRQHGGGEELHVSRRQARPHCREGEDWVGPLECWGQVGRWGTEGHQGKKGWHLRVLVALLEFKLPGPSSPSGCSGLS